MIKFFRKIRHNLIGKNKTEKFFKYVSGDKVTSSFTPPLATIHIKTLNKNEN